MEETKAAEAETKKRWADPSPETIQRLKAAHPDGLFSWEVDEIGVVVWHVPSRPCWLQFMDENSSGNFARSEVVKMLVDSCVDYPTLPELGAAIDWRPGLLGQVSTEIQKTATVSAKKAPKRL